MKSTTKNQSNFFLRHVETSACKPGQIPEEKHPQPNPGSILRSLAEHLLASTANSSKQQYFSIYLSPSAQINTPSERCFLPWDFQKTRST
ncbi:hypothetical protein DSO57_1038571 [Entomophthora muscae]|uniref:Uncharacterized protein n=1 Tax=Entomophthora muscae TaxID=34485 RepID=A0ACC2SBJ9_9FUNG|nr:hypothetical protein DSO57_1038571 [Entomophthora muscae]